MTVFYNLAIRFYHFAAWLAAPFNSKARLFVTGRLKWHQKLQQLIEPKASYIWIHCASLGEFEQGRPLIEELHQNYSEYKILLTFFSPSGYEIRKKYPFADVVCYLPMDTPSNAKKFLDSVKPAMAIFIKYEYWYHYMNELKRRSIPLYLVSAIFRSNQAFFSNTPWGRWYARLLNCFAHVFVQDEESAKLLGQKGFTKFTIAGDTRFDRVAAIAKSAKDIPIVDKFAGQKPILVAGSTWKPDEELLARFINETDCMKYIIAPHEVTPENVNKLTQLLKKPSIRFSLAQPLNIHKYDVLIIDSIGLLSSLYRYGKIAYIGGGFGVGIHNILEAATFGMPIIFGPKYQKFREARDLVRLNAAIAVTDYNGLHKALSELNENTARRDEMSAIPVEYVKKNRGATQQIIHQIFQQ